MDGKARLIAAIDSPVGIHEDDWICLMSLMDELSPIWEDVSCHHHMYFIPKKYKEALKKMILRPDVVITHPDDKDEREQENGMSVIFDDETLPDHERIQRSSRHHYILATTAYDLGDYNTAFNEIEMALEIEGSSPEYLSFSGTIALAIDKASKKHVVDPKEIDLSNLRCGACSGPYHQATGHIFFVNKEFKGVSCGICAGVFFAAKARKNGWRPYKQSNKKRKKQIRYHHQQRARHLSNAQRIVSEARSDNVYPHWPRGVDI